eukprot:g69903.t1
MKTAWQAVRDGLSESDKAKSNEDLTNKFNARVSKRMTDLFERPMTSHMSRKIYGAMAYREYAPANIDRSVYLSSVLGHVEDSEASRYYANVKVAELRQDLGSGWGPTVGRMECTAGCTFVPFKFGLSRSILVLWGLTFAFFLAYVYALCSKRIANWQWERRLHEKGRAARNRPPIWSTSLLGARTIAPIGLLFCCPTLICLWLFNDRNEDDIYCMLSAQGMPVAQVLLLVGLLFYDLGNLCRFYNRERTIDSMLSVSYALNPATPLRQSEKNDEISPMRSSFNSSFSNAKPEDLSIVARVAARAAGSAVLEAAGLPDPEQQRLNDPYRTSVLSIRPYRVLVLPVGKDGFWFLGIAKWLQAHVRGATSETLQVIGWDAWDRKSKYERWVRQNALRTDTHEVIQLQPARRDPTAIVRRQLRQLRNIQEVPKPQLGTCHTPVNTRISAGPTCDSGFTSISWNSTDAGKVDEALESALSDTSFGGETAASIIKAGNLTRPAEPLVEVPFPDEYLDMIIWPFPFNGGGLLKVPLFPVGVSYSEILLLLLLMMPLTDKHCYY